MENSITARGALLQALVEGPGYGLELIERVLKRTNGRFKLGFGSVYPMLRSLEREGLLRSWDGEPVQETAGRPRRYYELTAKGLRVAKDDKKAVAGLFSLRSAEEA